EVYNIAMYRSSADQLKNVREISKSQLKAGDLVFFKIDNNKVSHVGIYLGGNKFIHATTQKGVIVNSLDEEYYKKYYYTAGRVIMQGLP
ncbi:MAG TPA: NlpC/P60 family protein, partial [Bacteroidales bacterium]|nr:NlpC/P60 family protein [Bacteroidales bacterium]HQN15397.1 NlpC/P60 family protein [Bacteroidales bacterium]HQP14887.1 NlpC/P60 family protein [Bacteroidales bacterium]